MKLSVPLEVSEVAKLVNAEVLGASGRVTGINEIHKVQPGDLTFVDHNKYYEMVLNSPASFILIDKKMDFPEGKTLLITKEPFHAYNSLALQLRPFIPSSTTVSPTAQVGEGTVLQPNVFVGNYVKIGKNCVIHPNVTIYDYTEIGDNVIIQSNTAIGSDAFYYKTKRDSYEKMHTIGRTIIHDDVEIGSCCTIDSGVSGDTIIGRGTKIDNLVHIGHGVVVGEHCLFAAQVGIAGKTIIGNHVVLYGKVGVSKNLVIADHVTVLASSNVGDNLELGKTYFGSPCEEAKKMWRQYAMVRKLPELWEKLRQL